MREQQPSATRAATKKLSRRSVLAGGLGVTLSAGAASAWALDRFVVDHVEVADVSTREPAQATAATTEATGGSVSGRQYTSSTANLAVATKHGDGFTYYVADVQLTDATRLRSAFAQDKFGENIIEVPSAIASAHDAVFAINGDYYGFRSTGIVIRNGVSYRDEGARQGLAFYTDGSAKLYDETSTTARQLLADGVWNTLSFGPGLLSNGKVVDGIENVEVDTNVGNHSIQGQQPRTGVGVVADNHLIFIVVDGRSSTSSGVTMTQFAELFADFDCQIAYNLDGGGSSTMIFDGSVINVPGGRGNERGTSDILYIAK